MTIYHLTTNLARAIHRTLTKPWTPRREVVACPICKVTH